MRDGAKGLWTGALGALGLCCLVVAAVGAIAVWAELSGAWTAYFLMERTVAAATPVATALAGAAIIGSLAAAVRT